MALDSTKVKANASKAKMNSTTKRVRWPKVACQGRRQNIPVGRSKSVPPERSLASVNVRASCSGEVSQRQAGSRLGG